MKPLTRLLATVCTALLLDACDKEPALAPATDEPSLTLAAAGGLSSSFGLTATAASPSLIELAWQDNSANETGFEIHRSTTGPAGPFTVMGVAAANTTSDVDPNVPPGTQYCYKVRAFRNAGRKTSYGVFSNTACATTPNPPATPSNLDARPASSSAIGVSWTDRSSTEQGFRVERSTASGGPWESATITSPNATSYEEPRASEQQTCYRVLAFNSEGDSYPSNIDCTAPPLGPTNLVAAPAAQSIDVTWTDNSAVEDGYWVYRSDDGVTFAVVAGLPAGVSSFSDQWAISNTTYWYRVSARKDGGFSDPSNVASAMRSCAPTSPTEDACYDGADNDCDNLVDRYDPDCEFQRCDFYGCGQGFICDYDGFCVPHCGDGWQNGDEGDVDCGGSCAVKCQAGQHCWTSYDCASGLCVNSICQSPGGAQ